MSRLALFIFAGRRANMEVQKPYLDRILTDYPDAELDLWDLTRTPEDQEYLKTLHGAHGGRVSVLGHLHSGHPVRCLYPNGAQRPRGWRRCECMTHKPPYEKPYLWYAQNQASFETATFIKMDDDVLFLETDRLDALIAPLREHPNRVISANVANNAVCAKYEPGLVKRLDALSEPRDARYDKQWWALHCEAGFARQSHDWFLDERPFSDGPVRYVRTRPGEAISINCIAFTYPTMVRLARSFERNSRLGDEGTVDTMLPWIARDFHAAHLTFGPQEEGMTPTELNDLRKRYTQLSEDYLS